MRFPHRHTLQHRTAEYYPAPPLSDLGKRHIHTSNQDVGKHQRAWYQPEQLGTGSWDAQKNSPSYYPSVTRLKLRCCPPLDGAPSEYTPTFVTSSSRVPQVKVPADSCRAYHTTLTLRSAPYNTSVSPENMLPPEATASSILANKGGHPTTRTAPPVHTFRVPISRCQQISWYSPPSLAMVTESRLCPRPPPRQGARSWSSKRPRRSSLVSRMNMVAVV